MQEVGDWWVGVQPPKLGWWKLTGLARPQEPRGQMGQKSTRQVKLLLQVPVQDPGGAGPRMGIVWWGR